MLYTSLAGACIPLGGLLASVERISPGWLEREFRHFVVAFGGGALLAAVSLVLVPDGAAHLANAGLAVTLLLGGGIAFFALELWLGRRRAEAPQFSAMLSDYLPESMALGGLFAAGGDGAPLLALLIGLQNLPEGFNAYRELAAARGGGSRRALLPMLALVPVGPMMGLAGWLWLSAQPALLGAVMLFSAGGILYLIFQDIAPQSRLERHWAPPLGAVGGFGLGLLGHLLVVG